MELDLNQLQDLTPEQATQIRKALKGKSKYKKKGVYREKYNKVRFLNPDEWETFYYSLSENNRKYFMFLFLTGMRYKEAKHVTLDHFDWSNREIIIYKPKGGLQRQVNFSSWGKKEIKRIFEGKNKNDTLNFPTIQHMRHLLQKHCRENKIKNWEDLSVHNIRKQHENYLIALDLPYQKISKHMGHTPKTAQEHYNSSSFIKDKKQLDKIRTWLGDIFGYENN